jgi:hypothetical protein
MVAGTFLANATLQILRIGFLEQPRLVDPVVRRGQG